MRRLMLLRHAKSDWSHGLRDHDRPLAPRGVAAAPIVGRYLAEQKLLPDRALVSTSRRTRETWDLVSPELGRDVTADFDDRIYEASARMLLVALQGTSATVQTLLMVGHNPGMQDLAKRLMTDDDGDADARARLLAKFPTAALAVIDLAIDDWRAIGADTGRLERFVTPRGLAADAD